MEDKPLTVDLWMLIASMFLAMLLIVPQASAMRRQWGLQTMAGNREGVQPLAGWGGRVQRAFRNLLENLLFFAVVVLTAQVAGAANEMTALGSQIFFGSRVAHAVVYIAGIPWLRSVAWAGGVAGIVIIALQL